MKTGISCIIPAFNCAADLPSAVNSVFHQIYQDWELWICVDPGSTDSTLWTARKLALEDPRVKVLQPDQRGVAAARNAGLQTATAPFVAFLDADDIWLPSKLEEQLNFMITAGHAFSCTQFRRFDGRLGVTGRVISPPEKMSRFRLLQQNSILCSSVMLDLRAFKNPVRFDEKGCEDFALWLKLLREVGFCHGLQKDLVRYRISAGSRGASKWRSLKETWAVYRDDGLSAAARAAVMLPFILRGFAKYSRF
jgi:teichuronic acid biosynthesis glycosyltransferase TuaG